MLTGVAFNIGSFSVHWYGIIIGSAILISLFIVRYFSKKAGLDKDMALDLALWAIPLAVIGARLYYILFRLDYYLGQPDPLGAMIRISDGGLAIYGAVIGGVIGGILYSRFGFYDGLFNKKTRRRTSFWKIADITIPCLIMGQAMGRWGNFFNKEAFGPVVTDAALQWFPMAVYIDIPHTVDGVACAQPWHYATFFYESAWCFLVFAFLLIYRLKWQKAEGEILFWYLALYGFERMLVEGLRSDSLYIGNTGIRVSQVLSALMVVVGVVFIILLRTGKLKLGDERKAALAAKGLADDAPDESEKETIEKTKTEEADES